MFSADLGVNQVAPATDPPFQKVALLLHGDGTNGAQNNTFVDYSYPGGYAVSFDGNGDYLSVGANTAFDLLSSDFTVEFWVSVVNPAATSGGVAVCVGNGSGYWQILVRDNAINVNNSPNGSNFYQWQSSVSLTTGWQHVAWTKSSGTQRLFFNGTLLTPTGTAPTSTANNNLFIGANYNGGTTGLNGFISNLRIVKGTALYTSSFTPSNQPLTAVSGTSILTCQSATIVDNSPNAFTITANGNAAAVSSKTITRTGNVAQGTFSPFSLAEGQWSNYFDGTGDYLSINFSSGSTISGDFTWESWVYETGSSAYGEPLGWRDKGTSGWQGIIINRDNNTNNVNCNINQTGGLTLTQTSGTYTKNAWHHLALTRSGSTVTLFVNGVSVASGTYSGSFNPSSSYWIGSDPFNNVAAAQFGGYISNQRFVNGTAVYTANFTPPTSPLTAITNTSLLTCQSNRFKDNSSNNFTITRNGDTKVTAFSPFAPSAAYSASTNGGSAYFDGTGDYLSVPSNSAFLMGTSTDFCMEGWIYPTEAPANADAIYSSYPDTTSNNWIIWFQSGKLGVYQYPSSAFTTNAFQSTTVINVGVWTHFAFTRSGSVFRLFINGVQEATYTGSVDFGAANKSLEIGRYGSNSTSNFNGYISNLRHIVGNALYTSNFTPPTAPLTAVANTQLLLNCTNAGIIDNAGKNDIETVGNAQISTSVKKYGTGSLYFDGTGDYLRYISTPDTTFGTGDFTIEGWVYSNSISSTQVVFARRSSVTARGIISYFDSSKLAFRAGDTSTLAWEVSIDSGTLSSSTWYHFALTRSGNAWRAFVNGTQVGSTITWSGSVVDETSNWIIGADSDGTAYSLNGYIDDLRITKGQALYTSNFTPPTQAFPNV